MKWLRSFAPMETPEDYYRSVFQRPLTEDERHMLTMADLALRDHPFDVDDLLENPAPEAPAARIGKVVPFPSNAVASPPFHPEENKPPPTKRHARRPRRKPSEG